MARLLEFAVEKTKGQKRAVLSFSNIAARLGVSAQTMNNWLTRGISKDGALKAEREFGCSADWLLHGNGEKVVAPPPASPPKDYADRRLATESDWALLNDIKTAMESSRLAAKIEEIRSEVRDMEQFAAKLYKPK